MRIQKEGEHMKCMIIKDGKGYFSLDGSKLQEIDKITKDDLLNLLDIVISSDTEMDSYSDDTLQQPAQKIIYRNLFQKLSDLSVNRTRFKDESEALYRSAIEKYESALREEPQ